jgi:hypothetical protein
LGKVIAHVDLDAFYAQCEVCFSNYFPPPMRVMAVMTILLIASATKAVTKYIALTLVYCLAHKINQHFNYTTGYSRS